MGDYFTMQSTRHSKEITRVGTKNYMSNEWYLAGNDVIVNREDFEKMDVYSFGCVAYKLDKKKDYLPLNFFEKKATYERYVERYEKFKIEENDFDSDYKELLLGLLDPNVNSRFSIDMIYETKFIKNIKDLTHCYSMNLNDNIKNLLEIQKIEYSDFLKNRNFEIKNDEDISLDENFEIVDYSENIENGENYNLNFYDNFNFNEISERNSINNQAHERISS
jgi:serine/threonine protein kinase